jgi:hypothetical protein
MLRFALPFLFAALAAMPTTAQERPAAPYGYMIKESMRDGSPLPNGKKEHIWLVTRDETKARELVTQLRQIHKLHVEAIPLGSELEFSDAVQVIKAQIEARKRAQAAAKAAQSVSGTQWQVLNLSGAPFKYLWFYANGNVESGFTPGALANSWGEWTQKGEQIQIRKSGSSSLMLTGTWEKKGDVMELKKDGAVIRIAFDKKTDR